MLVQGNPVRAVPLQRFLLQMVMVQVVVLETLLAHPLVREMLVVVMRRVLTSGPNAMSTGSRQKILLPEVLSLVPLSRRSEQHLHLGL